MARKLVDLASTSAAVKQVVAHTLPETNASTRVLEKVGMVFAGEVMDPDDGRVWRWHVDVGSSPGGASLKKGRAIASYRSHE